MVKKGRSDMAGSGKGNNSGWLTLKVGEREVLYRPPPPPEINWKQEHCNPSLLRTAHHKSGAFFNGIPSPDPVYKEKWWRKKIQKDIQKK